MRKHRIYESHAPGKCHLCAWERHTELLRRRKERYEGKRIIADELTEVEEPYCPSTGPLFNEEEYEMGVINWYLGK